MWATLRNGAKEVISHCVESGHVGFFDAPALLDYPSVFGHVSMFPASVEAPSLNAQISGLRERIWDGGTGPSEDSWPDIGNLLSYSVYDV